MSNYNFETANTDTIVNPEETAYALLAVLAALAAEIVDGDSKRKDALLSKLDQAYLMNNKATSSTEIARMAKFIKAAL
ncbi:hypothetical protein QBC30_003137 [Citrobacter freundii]|uniref:hypothetical protein n=1 Tax=Citrobacter freundii TaxID=546 RepID=UPI0023B012C6|nr:hypothetical protein [Citrobacter freundii]EKW1512738.1 hypothetical protein [Citrobacter freundii]MDE9696299.1 hypothetical protein [Citrobacter freundii]MEB0811856.1 hypothetical protein [Citrobacter freundii]WOP97128.1 hypothetical protein R2X28_18480 [Citrobacter freundii]WOQ02182.1 hypothetical protein R2X29_18465 [Citrobacter freundii]